MQDLTTGQRNTGQDEAGMQADGSCRTVIGIWGTRQCSLLSQHVHCRNCPVYARTGRRMLDRPATARQPDHDRVPVEASTADRSHAGKDLSLIVFRAGGEWLALPTLLAREVVAFQAAHSVPHRIDPRFPGIVNVRGELLPCVNLEALLGVQPAGPDTAATPRNRRMLVIAKNDSVWVAPVDAIDGVHRVPEASLLMSPVTVDLAASRLTRALIDLPMGRTGLIDDDLLWQALGGLGR